MGWIDCKYVKGTSFSAKKVSMNSWYLIDYQLLHHKDLNDYSNLEEFAYGILCFGTNNILNYVSPGIRIIIRVLFATHRLQNSLVKLLHLLHEALQGANVGFLQGFQ